MTQLSVEFRGVYIIHDQVSQSVSLPFGFDHVYVNGSSVSECQMLRHAPVVYGLFLCRGGVHRHRRDQIRRIINSANVLIILVYQDLMW